MAGQIFYDVAQGKPLSVCQDSNSTSKVIDMLWRYAFEWVVIDRWTQSETHVELENQVVDAPPIEVEFSTDGLTYARASVTHGVVMSDRGSKGTHRSLQIFFEKRASGRYVRITYQNTIWDYKVRASLRTFQVAAQERAKLVEPFHLQKSEESEYSTIRAIVLGDSNSVMRYGWVKGLADAGIEVVQNVSLGSSSNSILGTQLAQITEFDADVILINSTVNEYIPIRDRMYDTELSRQFIRHVQSWAARHDILPVFIIQPQQRILDDIAAGNAIFDQPSFNAEMCVDLGLPYINGFELAEELAIGWGRPLHSLFMDPAHLNHPTAQTIGASIGDRVRRFITDEWTAEKRRVDPTILTHDFKVLQLGNDVERPVESAIDKQPIRRRLTNALIDQEMLTVTSGRQLTIPIPEGWEVVAFMMNARRCNASIRIQGSNEVVRRADFAGYEGESGHPFVCVRSLVNPVRPSGGGVVIDCVKPQQWHELDEIANLNVPTRSDDELEIEISLLVIRNSVRTEPYLRVIDADLDLTRSASVRFALSG